MKETHCPQGGILNHMTHKYYALIASMQFYIEPEVSWSSWLQKACISDGALTELGKFLQSRIAGGTFVDIPCGLEAPIVTDIVQNLGICTYIEVDNSAEVLGARLQEPTRTIGDMTVHTHLADVLEFIAQLEIHEQSQKRAVYISGLQPNKEFCKNPTNVSTVVTPYLEALYNELERCNRTGDLVILNDAVALVSGIDEEKYPTIHPSIALAKRGFHCQRTCPFNKVQVFEKI